MRKFMSKQLLEVESELASVGHSADSLGLDVGDHADEIHWEKVAALSAEKWIEDIRNFRIRLERAEGLLRAYEIHRKNNLGE